MMKFLTIAVIVMIALLMVNPGPTKVGHALLRGLESAQDGTRGQVLDMVGLKR